jgi:hypothetical protein
MLSIDAYRVRPRMMHASPSTKLSLCEDLFIGGNNTFIFILIATMDEA